MFLFYTHQTDFETALFDETETRHCIQVLRKQVGDEISFTDGKGHIFSGKIASIGKRHFSCQIIGHVDTPHFLPVQIHLAIAPTKNMDRFEWFLEKATELGVSKIIPLICENSERRKIRHERLEKILVSAMKQSLSAHLPELAATTLFEGFLKNLATEPTHQRFIAHCRDSQLPQLFNCFQADEDVILLIGPEGDFSVEEIDLAKKVGFQEVSLGKSRMRTETAGVVGVHSLSLKATI